MASDPVSPQAGDERCDGLAVLYSAANEQWIHAEQMRWTLLYNFLVGNTILLLVWVTLFVELASGSQSLDLRIVLIGLCGVGIAGSVVWILIEQRANQFSIAFFECGLELEGSLEPDPKKPIGVFRKADVERNRGWVKTHAVVVTVPAVFSAIYVALLRRHHKIKFTLRRPERIVVTCSRRTP